jgi:hypothetical protein
MSSKQPVRLKELPGGAIRDAVLLDGMGKEEVAAAQGSWEPFLESELARLKNEGVPPAAWPQHRHWDWREKQKTIDGLLAYRIFGVECNSQVQGLMLVATAGKISRIASQKGRPLVYVHFLATAPWNSPLVVAQPRFSGIGTVLLASAIQLSVDEEFSGRVGLHSLPQADAWYRKCGMTDLGPDASEKQNLTYFEMTPEQAKAFLN